VRSCSEPTMSFHSGLIDRFIGGERKPASAERMIINVRSLLILNEKRELEYRGTIIPIGITIPNRSTAIPLSPVVKALEIAKAPAASPAEAIDPVSWWTLK